VADTVYTGSIDDIDALVAMCHFPPSAYVLVEQLPRHVIVGAEERQNLLRFTRLSEVGEHIRLSDYTSGRVFTTEGELRWQQKDRNEGQDNQFQVVYVGPEREQLPIKKDEAQSKKLSDAPELPDTHYLLFGERLDADDIASIGSPAQEGDFAQLRIPRLLRYPRRPGARIPRRLQLAVREYVDEITGKVHLFRFRDLQVGED
jgi:hypothetical protein